MCCSTYASLPRVAPIGMAAAYVLQCSAGSFRCELAAACAPVRGRLRVRTPGRLCVHARVCSRTCARTEIRWFDWIDVLSASAPRVPESMINPTWWRQGNSGALFAAAMAVQATKSAETAEGAPPG
jgi:hypothetical protein